MYPITNELVQILYEERLREALGPHYRSMHQVPSVVGAHRQWSPIGRFRYTMASALRWVAAGIEPRSGGLETTCPTLFDY
jgi:hypothetical protein